MGKAWIIAKLPEFVREVFRDFCLAHKALEEQFRIFDRDGQVDFEAVRDLIGQSRDKGLLWRLKDTAHHVFRNDPDDPLVGRFLDWGMGYIFHEAVKLKEDSYQRITYAPWYEEMLGGDLPDAAQDIAHELFQVLAQTVESMRREIDRIRFILSKCRQLLPIYLSRHRDNQLLARLIFAQNRLMREVFGDEYDTLVSTIYEGKPERMYRLASQSLRHGGWMEEAAQAAEVAYKINPRDKMVLQEKKIIDNWLSRMKS